MELGRTFGDAEPPRLVALDRTGKPLDTPDGDPAIGAAEPLAAAAGKLLLARPPGAGVNLLQKASLTPG